jgi:hypothetical protein
MPVTSAIFVRNQATIFPSGRGCFLFAERPATGMTLSRTHERVEGLVFIGILGKIGRKPKKLAEKTRIPVLCGIFLECFLKNGKSRL